MNIKTSPNTLMYLIILFLVGVFTGATMTETYPEDRLNIINEHVSEYVTTTQDKQNTLDGCYIVVEDFMTKDIKYKKQLGI